MSMKTWERLSRGSSSPGRKIVRFSFASLLVAICLVLWVNFDQDRLLPNISIVNNPTPSLPQSCNATRETVERYQLSKPVHYLRREIIATPSDSRLKVLERLDVPLTDYHHGNLTEQGTGEQTLDACSEPITLQVPIPPKPVDASHIDFGVATTFDRLYESLDGFAHWAGHTKARIFALIEPHGFLSKLTNKAQALGIDLHIVESSMEYNARYFSLLKLLLENVVDETQWSCVIDDDTFFLSMPALVERLGQYDAKKPFYIGGLSESVPQIGVFGVMGFGGAGIFVSRPLLTQLGEVYDKCSKMEGTGDRKIAYCIYQYTTTKLTVEQGLRQLDLMHDASGFFEAGRELPLSVHHWKSWYQADMIQLSAVSTVCGDSCLLRQWHFADGWLLTNGYSIVKYSKEKPEGDVSMERTWDDHNGAVQDSFLHALGPLREKDEGKISYRLEDAFVEDGQVRQFYIQRDNTNGDSVLELVWRSA